LRGATLAQKGRIEMIGRHPAEQAPAGPADKADPLTILGEHPAPEDQFGGGDICSPEAEPPTDDDKPLD
jgi:hypothetical protein